MTRIEDYSLVGQKGSFIKDIDFLDDDVFFVFQLILVNDSISWLSGTLERSIDNQMCYTEIKPWKEAFNNKLC